MYLELIEKYMEKNQWVRPQAPAGSAQMQAAEKALQCSFPKELKQLFSEMDGDRWLLFSIPSGRCCRHFCHLSLGA